MSVNINDANRKEMTNLPNRAKLKKNRAMDIFVILLVALIVLICLLPLLNVLAMSLSAEISVINRRVFFWPVQLDLTAYENVFKDRSMVRSLGLTTVLTIVSAAFSMTLTTLCAYPLSQNNFVGRTFFNTLIIFTMYFNAGAIPDYLNIDRLNLLDNFWVMVLPIGISVFNMIIMKSFFQQIPDSLRESAELDGASHWTILIRIYLPLSTSALATLTLFYAVSRWNGFADARIYLSSPSLYPIQYKLYQLINGMSSMEASMEGIAVKKVATESMKSASIVFATLPILLVYPWLQKYFVTGVTVGAVKG